MDISHSTIITKCQEIGCNYLLPKNINNVFYCKSCNKQICINCMIFNKNQNQKISPQYIGMCNTCIWFDLG